MDLDTGIAIEPKSRTKTSAGAWCGHAESVTEASCTTQTSFIAAARWVGGSSTFASRGIGCPLLPLKRDVNWLVR